MESVKVVGEYTCFTEPLTVELAPESLAPTGIRNGEMQTVGIYVVPVLCSGVVTKGVLI